LSSTLAAVDYDEDGDEYYDDGTLRAGYDDDVAGYQAAVEAAEAERAAMRASGPESVPPARVMLDELDEYRSEWLGQRQWRERMEAAGALSPGARWRARDELSRALGEMP